MATVTMRNVRTGELKLVDDQGQEFLDLVKERYEHQGAPKPLWEQTGGAHARRLVTEADDGALQEEQLGYDNKPLGDVVYDTTEVGPEPAPHLALTPGEVEMGMDPEEKQEQLQEQFARDQARKRGETLEEGLEAIASSPIPVDSETQDRLDGALEDEESEDVDSGPSTKELRARAAELGIHGRSSMNKEQLESAIAQAEDDGEAEDEEGAEEGATEEATA